MTQNIIIKEVAIYHPENKVNNEYFLNHFKEQGKDIEDFLKMMGRESRYFSYDDKENTLTMATEASIAVLDRANLASEDLDMIVFSSGTPEYIQPTNAIHIHRTLKCKPNVIAYDMNTNCVGMIIAMEQVTRYMLANPSIKYALIVGADQLNRHSKETDEITYPNFGEGAAAVILERVENTISGFVDSTYYTDSSGADNILLPACGLSNVHNENVSKEDKMIQWIPFDGTAPVKVAIADIERLLDKHGISKDKVKQYFFSQFSKKNIDLIAEGLNEEQAKFIYIGDEFGYTGTSSPFIALFAALEQGKINRGDVIVFWSVGAGWTISTVVYRF